MIMRTTLRPSALAIALASTLILAAPSAWAVTFDFAHFAANEGGPYTASESPGEGGYSSFTMTVGGVTVKATATHGIADAFVYLDGRSDGRLAGMGVCQHEDGDCEGSEDDNVQTDEILRLEFDQAVTIDSMIFRDQDHFTNKFAADDQFRLRVDGSGVDPFSTFNFPTSASDPNPWTPPILLQGTIFEFKHKSEDFYISQLDVDTAPVPEPTTLGLLGMGLFATGMRARRRRH